MKVKHITTLLPQVVQAGVVPGMPLYELLELMEKLHAPIEEVLRRLDHFFDPRRCDEACLGPLARWVDLERLLYEPGPGGTRGRLAVTPAALRLVIAKSAELAKRRGTLQGLQSFLELATGSEDFEFQESGKLAAPFHLTVKAPASLRAQQALIERIVVSEKPAHMTHEITYSVPAGR